RADIRRLRQLEDENAALRGQLDKQQSAFREAVVTRDTNIAELRRALSQQCTTGSSVSGEHSATLHQVVADLQRRFASEARRAAALAERLSKANAALSEERAGRVAAERENCTLRRELDAIETSVHAAYCGHATSANAPRNQRMDGLTLLY